MRFITTVFGGTMAAVMLLAGCGDSTSSNGNVSSASSSSSETSAISSASSSSLAALGSTDMAGQLVVDPARGVVDDTALVRANEAFNGDIFTGLEEEGGNLFYSPFSIFTALSMTYAGAQNHTKAEFETVLHYDENLSVHESFALLLENSEYAYNTFDIANSLWPQEGYPFKEDFIYTVYRGYDSEAYYMDYRNDYENARMTINGWVEEKTHDKIVDLIPEGALDTSTRLVLVNALYFKGTWEYAFDKNETDKQPFYLSDGSEKEADMMHMEANASYYENSVFKALELPYKAHEFSMLIFLPKTAADMAAMQTALFETGSPSLYRAGMKEIALPISIPKFKIKWGTESLKPLLIGLGMGDAFDGNLADFTGMWYRQFDENLYISDVLHQAFIEVNEEGAEAAAATAVIIAETSGVMEPTTFTADHPFVFFIVDNKTGMTVFSGKVEDPTL